MQQSWQSQETSQQGATELEGDRCGSLRGYHLDSQQDVEGQEDSGELHHLQVPKK